MFFDISTSSVRFVLCVNCFVFLFGFFHCHILYFSIPFSLDSKLCYFTYWYLLFVAYIPNQIQLGTCFAFFSSIVVFWGATVIRTFHVWSIWIRTSLVTLFAYQQLQWCVSCVRAMYSCFKIILDANTHRILCGLWRLWVEF